VKKDDVITHINDEEVDSTDDVVRAMRDARTEGDVTLKVLRDGKEQTIEVRIPRKLKTADL
jgi:serine protease Do